MTDLRRAVWSGVLASVILAGGALAQQRVPAQQSPRDPLRLTGLPNGVFRFSQGRLSGQIDLSSQLNGCTTGIFYGMDPASRPGASALGGRVIDLVRKAGRWYLTFQVNLPPNCNVEGMCGAGNNIGLVWLGLSPSLKVLGKQVEVVEDCQSATNAQDYTGVKDPREPSSGQPLLELRGGVLKFTRTAPAPDNQVGRYRTQTLNYSHARPELGLQVGAVKVVTK